MRGQGKSIREVAAELCCSPSTVVREERRNAAPRQIRSRLSPLDKARYADKQTSKRIRKKTRERGCLLDAHAEARVRVGDVWLLESRWVRAELH